MPVSVSNAKKKRKVKKPTDVNGRLIIPPVIIIAVVVFLDQISKMMIVQRFNEGETVSVLGSFFQLRLIYNRGGALGTNLGSGDFYLGTSILILAAILYLIYHNRKTPMMSWPLAFCAGGAIGNVADRIFNGKVVDFLDFDFFDFSLFGNTITRWWTFNVADIAITVGIIFLILYILFTPNKKPAESESTPDSSGELPRPASDAE